MKARRVQVQMSYDHETWTVVGEGSISGAPTWMRTVDHDGNILSFGAGVPTQKDQRAIGTMSEESERPDAAKAEAFDEIRLIDFSATTDAERGARVREFLRDYRKSARTTARATDSQEGGR